MSTPANTSLRIRALAHPLRMRLLWELSAGPANVSDLAARLDEPANSVSFHIHQLAKYGFAEKCDGPAGTSKRESWWKKGDGETQVDIEELPRTPEGDLTMGSLAAISQAVFSQRSSRFLAAVEHFRGEKNTAEHVTWPMMAAETAVYLTEQEMGEVNAEIVALFERISKAHGEEHSGTRRCTFAVDLFLEAPRSTSPAKPSAPPTP